MKGMTISDFTIKYMCSRIFIINVLKQLNIYHKHLETKLQTQRKRHYTNSFLGAISMKNKAMSILQQTTQIIQTQLTQLVSNE